jgi:hypothetical protein
MTAGFAGSAFAILRVDSSPESGQHKIPRIRARTKPVNPSHRMSPASRGWFAPVSGAVFVAMICPLKQFSPPANAGLFVKFLRCGPRRQLTLF